MQCTPSVTWARNAPQQSAVSCLKHDLVNNFTIQVHADFFRFYTFSNTQDVITIGTDIYKSGLPLSKIEHNQGFAEDFLAVWAGHNNMIFPKRLNLPPTKSLLEPNGGRLAITLPPKARDQDDAAQNHRNSQENIDQPQKSPIRLSPVMTKLQTETIKCSMDDVVKSSNQKYNKNRINQPQNKDYPHKPEIVKQSFQARNLNPNNVINSRQQKRYEQRIKTHNQQKLFEAYAANG